MAEKHEHQQQQERSGQPDDPAPMYQPPAAYSPMPIQPDHAYPEGPMPAQPMPAHPPMHQPMPQPMQQPIQPMHPPMPEPGPYQPNIPLQPINQENKNPKGYQTVAPLHALNREPTPVDCPVCGMREVTRTQAKSGNTTHGWAAILCFCCCLGCIPYIMTSLKDVEHYCGHCSALLAVWHNSGHVDIQQNGQKIAQQPGQQAGKKEKKNKK